MSSNLGQAITGISSGKETSVMTVFPSIAANGLGRMLGNLYDSLPIKFNGIKLSYFLFPLPTAPLAALLYLLAKVTGNRYELTTRAVKVWNASGSQLQGQVLLADVDSVDVIQRSGQEFFHAADLHLLGADGKTLLVLEGIPRADVFRQTILKARASAQQVKSSLAQIEARAKA